MTVQLAILIAFVIILVLALASVLPMVWWGVCIAYLATSKAVEVLQGARP